MKQQKQNDIRQLQRRHAETADRLVRRYRVAARKPTLPKPDRLRITPLGGQNGIGEKNMIVLEYDNDALVLDCGFDLGVDLPGINYAIPATDYLQTIKHKLRGYVISHGHMDHIGALVHTVPKYPAPIFGSQFTIGMVQAQIEKAHEDGLNFTPDYRVMNMEMHEKVTLGNLSVELVRVTHSVPESSAIVIDTPVGRVINTGDFRLDPEPLDTLPSDTVRLRQLGDEGVLLLMSESTNTTKLGRTPTEHTLQDSFESLIAQSPGRVFVAVFSTNMNRVQMIINAAHTHGRKVALDGRSMVTVAELAVRLGNLKIPKGTLVAMADTTKVPDDKLVVICTGGQGEPGAAMSRMSAGEHRYINLKKGDSVVISSTPIPGNETSYQQIGDDLATIGVKQFRHPTHEIDGCGPLHVSGHAARDEHAEMIRLTRPRYFMPIYGGALNRAYHRDIAMTEGIPASHILMLENGETVELHDRQARIAGRVTAGSLLVDQTGTVVSEIVTRDRLLLRDEGFLVVMVTIHKKTGQLLASPDIMTRGAMSVRDNGEVIEGLRTEIKRQLIVQRRARSSIDTLKQALRDTTTAYIYKRMQKTPLVVAVVNIVDTNGRTNIIKKPVAEVHS